MSKRWDLRRLGDEEFQRLAQVLFQIKFRDAKHAPANQADGGRDPKSSFAHMQAKFHDNERLSSAKVRSDIKQYSRSWPTTQSRNALRRVSRDTGAHGGQKAIPPPRTSDFGE